MTTADILAALQRALAACYMRGGTSKGLFFEAQDLPAEPALRDAVLLRAIGSPDPYAKQIDGMGGATSSTSKVVLVSRSARADCDVDYLFGAVSIDRPLIDWSGNCGNLSAAVGPFALMRGLVDSVPRDGTAVVRIWQANIGKRITARVPMAAGRVVEDGDFHIDGVAFGGAEIRLEFHDPAGGAGQPLLPTGTHEHGRVARVNAARLDRAHAAVRMKLAASAEQASAGRPATPKIALLAAPTRHVCSDGRTLEAEDVDLLVRMLSMGAVHHAVPGTGVIALAVAAALPGTLAHRLARAREPASDEGAQSIRLGHPSGRVTASATLREDRGAWIADSATLSRSARCLMRGEVLVPDRLWYGVAREPAAGLTSQKIPP